MKKRMISLCLVLSMVLTFAGCGNESNGSADNTQGTTQQSGTDSAGEFLGAGTEKPDQLLWAAPVRSGVHSGAPEKGLASGLPDGDLRAGTPG